MPRTRRRDPFGRLLRVLAPLAVLLAAVAWAGAAAAHQVGLSRSELRAGDAGLTLELSLARADLRAIVPEVDASGDGVVDDAEVAAGVGRAGGLARHVAVTPEGGAVCPARVESMAPEEDGGVSVKLGLPGCAGRLVVDATAVFAALPSDHRHAAFVYPSAGDPEEHVLRRGSASFETWAFAAVAAPPAAAPPGALEVAWEYTVLGVEHILFGVDHVVFLLGLILVGGRWRQLVAMITAFTLAHSVTLALAVLGVVAPSPRLIEPIIALSVAYVGVENFIVKDAGKRWRIAGAFGLIHGFGFAGALGEVGLPKENLAVALATFNVGVELGQLALMALTVPLVLRLRKQEWFVPRGVQALSAAVAVAGLVWFVTRVLPES